MHKKRMISTGGYNPDFDAVLLIPIQKLIVDKNLKKETTGCILQRCKRSNKRGKALHHKAHISQITPRSISYLFQRVQVIHSSFPVHQEGFLVHLDIWRAPGNTHNHISTTKSITHVQSLWNTITRYSLLTITILITTTKPTTYVQNMWNTFIAYFLFTMSNHKLNIESRICYFHCIEE